jgi:hypothetical protein
VFLRLRLYIWYAEGAKIRPEGSALGVRHDAVDRSFCDAIKLNGWDEI